MPIRNPFARRPGPAVQEESQRPGSAAGTADPAHPGFERVDTVGSKASSAFSIRSRRSQDTGEYKLSVVNDSGVYLPPSPVEKETPWPRRYLGRTSSERSSIASGSGEIEHFSISRESFDSYRRSFDICAKSPVVIADPPAGLPARQSLDSYRFPRSPLRFPAGPRSPLASDQPQVQPHRWDQEPRALEEEGVGGGGGGGDGEGGEGGERDEKFEDVGLDDDENHTGGNGEHHDESLKHSWLRTQSQPQPRKRSFFFTKFGGSDSAAAAAADTGTGAGAGAGAPPPPVVEEGGTALSISRFLPLSGGRKKDPSGGQAAELGAMRPVAAGRDSGLERADTPVAGLRVQEVEG
ncbi:uncharacterized protein THITE_2169976 [Thermothielavioides terrestris NRRL 8126]|uniref:Uncharacterized protein n=1 Tax=Thermothielavioides terrestris (strain ATCC 38088 / NRRL 8126) TaxID=578455 RepID=G2QZ00_THETT|nr:uncharacterized protein THITE_2169976 [Thermothielavioides terrestris NRRL 8126]AEO65432.1 hypothetical protein THITE_2169976 [Thermothielavioides terrestris NRRL 8126]